MDLFNEVEENKLVKLLDSYNQSADYQTIQDICKHLSTADVVMAFNLRYKYGYYESIFDRGRYIPQDCVNDANVCTKIPLVIERNNKFYLALFSDTRKIHYADPTIEYFIQGSFKDIVDRYLGKFDGVIINPGFLEFSIDTYLLKYILDGLKKDDLEAYYTHIAELYRESIKSKK